MKSINKKSCFTAILTIFLLVPFVSKAQVYADKIIYLNIDWQLNMLLHNTEYFCRIVCRFPHE